MRARGNECITLCNYTVTTGCSKCRSDEAHFYSLYCGVVVVYCNYGAFFLTGTVHAQRTRTYLLHFHSKFIPVYSLASYLSLGDTVGLLTQDTELVAGA